MLSQLCGNIPTRQIKTQQETLTTQCHKHRISSPKDSTRNNSVYTPVRLRVLLYIDGICHALSCSWLAFDSAVYKKSVTFFVKYFLLFIHSKGQFIR